MGKWSLLSYHLTMRTPAYGGGPGLEIEYEKNMSMGDSCNTSRLYLSSHLGTHIDLPRHFVKDGKTVTDYPPDFWIFKNPVVVDVSPIDPGKIVNQADIDFDAISPDVDLLLIKTGFGRYRSDDIYWTKNPGFSDQLPEILRTRFRLLRAVGVDSISISSFVQRDIGRKAHKAFLKGETPLLIIEDLDLNRVGENSGLTQVIVAPLLVEGAEGSPCSVFAEIIE